jgi:hypothetical protein
MKVRHDWTGLLALLAVLQVSTLPAVTKVGQTSESGANASGDSPGGSDSYVIVNAGTDYNVYPYWSGASSCRFQMLYRQSEIGRSGHISWFAFQNADTARVTFDNVTVKMCETPMNQVTIKLDSNYGGRPPITVYGPASRLTGTGIANAWDSIPVSFDYTNNDNLLVEIIWNGAVTGSVPSYYGPRLPSRRTYVWDWQGRVGVNVDSALYNARFTFADHDVGCTEITAPAGVLDSGTVVVPACSVGNYGNQTEDFNVRMRIGTAYNETATVSGLVPGNRAGVTFPAWTAMPRGITAVSCSTELPGDITPSNDGQTGSGDVAVHDIGAVAIVAPTGSIAPGPIAPRADVRNYGTARETCRVFFKINTVPAYLESLDFPGGLPFADTTVAFPDWAAATGTYLARCSTCQSNDQVAANTVVSAGFQVGRADVGVTAIVAPTGNIDTSSAVVPSARIVNLGDFPATFKTFFCIDLGADAAAYADSLAVADLMPAAESTLAFAEWPKPHASGNYTTVCSTYLAGDGNRSNDVRTDNVAVRAPTPESGWVRKADMPLGSKNKKVRDGACLAYREETDASSYIYAFKGGNTLEFYAYNTEANTWATRESIPAVGTMGKKKRVKKGATLVQAEGKLYGTKGGSTLEFWRYSAGAGGWRQMADVPAGTKTVKYGAGAAAVTIGDTTYVYFLKGSSTREFYRHNTLTNAWETRADAPAGISGKPFKSGSCVTFDGVNTIYALKGYYDELFAYDCSTDAWTSRTGVPLIGRSGKKVRVKGGAGMAQHNGAVYLTKGGKTFEFWCYTVSSDQWLQGADVPNGGGKGVKGGGAMVYAAGEVGLYITKGNATQEFYKYGFSAGRSLRIADRPGSTIDKGELRVTPNPFSGATTIGYSLAKPGNVSLKILDVTGRLVAVLASGRHSAGSYTAFLPRERLARGVYLLRLASEGYTVGRKLIAE